KLGRVCLAASQNTQALLRKIYNTYIISKTIIAYEKNLSRSEPKVLLPGLARLPVRIRRLAEKGESILNFRGRKYKARMTKIIIYSATFAFGFGLVSLWSFWLVTRPPEIISESTPETYGLNFDKIEITAPDGITLAGWLIPDAGRRQDAPAIIIFHGNGADKSDMLSFAKVLHEKFAVLLMDLRYFGESDGKYSTLGFKERGDASRAIDFLESRGFKKIGVFGFSLGGAIAIMTASEDSRVQAVAAYASHTDLRSIGRDTYKILGPLKYPLVELMILWAKLFIDENVLRDSPFESAQELNIPLLLAHSREDDQIPFSHAERLKDSLKNNPRAEFYFMERGLHGEVSSEFDNRVREFFEHTLLPRD
ncbi:MAG: hypothetical protein UY61_C0022G0001, partial [Candidatus Adlerbacteria bacterium GW2011_GWC1_50_9]